MVEHDFVVFSIDIIVRAFIDTFITIKTFIFINKKMLKISKPQGIIFAIISIVSQVEIYIGIVIKKEY